MKIIKLTQFKTQFFEFLSIDANIFKTVASQSSEITYVF